MNESWKDVPGWEGFYQASSLGRIRRTNTKRIKAQHRHGNPYLQVWLCCPKRNSVCCLVHRLVLLAFKGLPPSAAHEGAHKDGDPSNNSASNLRWSTKHSNERDKVRHGTLLKGGRAPWSKLSSRSVRYCRKARARGVPLKALAAKYGVHFSTISAACCGVSWNG